MAEAGDKASLGDSASVVSLESCTDLLHGTSNQLFIKLKKKGNDLFKEESYQDAQAKYEEAAAHAEGDEVAALLHNKGATYEKLNKPDLALETYNEAIKMRPGYQKVLRRRCRLLNSLGKHQEALDDITELSFIEIQRHKLSTKPYMDSALYQDILADFIEAEKNKIIATRESLMPANSIIEGVLRPYYADPVSRIWRGLDRTPVDDLIEMENGNVEDLRGYLAAIRDLKRKKYDKIIDHCTNEINGPSSEDHLLNAYFLRATMQLVTAKIPEAVADFAHVSQSPLASPMLKSSTHLRQALRFTLQSTKGTSKVADEFSKAEDLCPENPDVYFHGALALIERGQPQTAMEMLNVGIQLCGKDASVLMKVLYWSIKFSISDKESERDESFARLIELEPTFDMADCHELYAQALMMFGEAKYDEAQVQMDKAIAYDPKDPTFKMKKILMSRWFGDTSQDTLDNLYKFVKNEEPCSLAYYHIGQLELVNGDFEKGFASLEKSIEVSSSIHEIEVRVGSKIEMQLQLKLNEKLKAAGLGSLAEEVSTLAMRHFV